LLSGVRTLHRTCSLNKNRLFVSSMRLTPGGQRKRCSKTFPTFLSESGHHYLEEPAYGLVFCFLPSGLFIEPVNWIKTDYSSHPWDSPLGASASAVQKRSRRFCPSPGTKI
jgi:hypothetical protein